MKLDKYEADLIEAIDKAEQFETVTDYELELQEAKLAAKHFLNKTGALERSERAQIVLSVQC